MRLIDKYLLKDYLAPLVYCLVAFSMMFIISHLFGHLSGFIDAGTPLLLVIKYYLLMLVPAIEHILPASLLLATLYTLWQLSRNNELIAMRANGMSLYRLMLPFILVGIALSVISVIVKETASPAALRWTTEFDDNDYQVPGEHVAYDFAHYNSLGRRLWLIGQMDMEAPSRLLDVKVTQERPDGSRSHEIRAPKAEWLDGTWWFYDMAVQKYDPLDNPVGTAEPAVPGAATVKEQAFYHEEPSVFVSEVRRWEYLSSREMAEYLKARPLLSDEDVAQKRSDLHARLAMPWACLIVTLFGIPVGAKGGRQSALTGIFVAILLLFGFYALSQIGIILAKTQRIWPWLGAWLSNIVFLLTGVKMILTLQ